MQKKTYNETQLLHASESEAKGWEGKWTTVNLNDGKELQGRIKQVEYSASEPTPNGGTWVCLVMEHRIFVDKMKSMTINEE
jgi:hypothetical protein